MKNQIIFIITFLFILSVNSLESTDKGCCHSSGVKAEVCLCEGIYECNVKPVVYGETTYLPMCIESECQKNCYFADWLITIIATVAVFIIDLIIVFLFWLCCRTKE